MDEITVEWKIADWQIEATAYADPSNWIDGVYWLELKTETEIDLSSCGELALGFRGLWTQMQLGEAVGEVTYEPTEALTLRLAGTIDCIARQIVVLEVVATVAW